MTGDPGVGEGQLAEDLFLHLVAERAERTRKVHGSRRMAYTGNPPIARSRWFQPVQPFLAQGQQVDVVVDVAGDVVPLALLVELPQHLREGDLPGYAGRTPDRLVQRRGRRLSREARGYGQTTARWC